VMARVAALVVVEPVTFALMEALVLLVTATVFTVTVTDVAPSATVAVAGTDALVLDAASVTLVPPAGAGPLRVTVNSEVLPPTTEVGLSATEATLVGIAVSVAVRLSSVVNTTTVAVWFAVTYGTAMLKSAVVSPSAR